MNKQDKEIKGLDKEIRELAELRSVADLAKAHDYDVISLAKAHIDLYSDYLALLDKLKNPSDEMIDAAFNAHMELINNGVTDYNLGEIIFNSMAAVLLKEIE